MRKTMAVLAGVAAMAAGAGAAQEVLDGNAARALLFSANGVAVRIYPRPFLSEAEQDILRKVAADNVPHYGAIAVSPADGLATEATTARGNYHDVESAGAAVPADCNAKRSRGGPPCVIVAEVLPRGWEARPLQLSAGASAALRGEYRRARGERAFAISPSSGGFGIGTGPGAAASALASCNAAGGVGDCRVVVAD